MEHTYTNKLVLIYLKFKCNWPPCILSGNLSQGVFEAYMVTVSNLLQCGSVFLSTEKQWSAFTSQCVSMSASPEPAILVLNLFVLT